MYVDDTIYLGLADGRRVCLAPNMANRHGLIAGASGTGKTITMKVMAESFSDAGVPVFLCDIKGDVSGLATPGVPSAGMEKRIDKFGILHNGIGKASFGTDKILGNIRAYFGAVLKSRPQAVKGVFVKSLTLSTTMGVGVKIDVADAEKFCSTAE